jgi:hypothetical protein
MLRKYFLVVFVLMGTRLGVHDMHFKDGSTAMLLEIMCICITAFAGG